MNVRADPSGSPARERRDNRHPAAHATGYIGQLEVERVVPNALSRGKWLGTASARQLSRARTKRLGVKPLHLGVVLALLSAAASAAETIKLSGRAMGTTWTATFVQPEPALDPKSVSGQIADRLEQLEQQFSTYRPDSELSRFNASASTEWIAVSPGLAHVAAESRRVSELTGGAFDVTVDPLVRLWGFGPQRRTGDLPTEAEIAAARRFVDWRQLEARAQPAALRKQSFPRLSADFSSMAKGFAADAVGELFASLRAVNHLIQIGGDVKTSGHSAGGESWRTGIEQPRAGAHPIAVVVGLSGQALSTSGAQRNFFMVEGRRYGHIIDPRTGRPASSDLASISVVASSCATSSALATALFVLGPDEGFQLAERHGLAALFMISDGDEISQRPTPEFDKLRR